MIIGAYRWIIISVLIDFSDRKSCLLCLLFLFEELKQTKFCDMQWWWLTFRPSSDTCLKQLILRLIDARWCLPSSMPWRIIYIMERRSKRVRTWNLNKPLIWSVYAYIIFLQMSEALMWPPSDLRSSSVRLLAAHSLWKKLSIELVTLLRPSEFSEKKKKEERNNKEQVKRCMN